MPKIILASASPQRRKLLKFLGLKFSVRPSRAKEIASIETTCADLVVKNAVLKAQEVASRNKEGLVIGADTLVYDGKGQIIGKPRDLSHAKKILKNLAKQPHWVYTGLAVIDAKTGKKMTGYEKTKIYMGRLSDEEIDRYHSHVSPLDKAGGFDIEGKGGLFIDRIEGCYYNVIGLPLAKLCAMLRKFGVKILMLFFAANLAGCATEYNLATGQQESLMYSTEKEVKIGESVAAQFDKHFKINTDIDINERVERILDRLVEVCDRKELVYTIKVIDEDVMNAVSLPGGYIYVYKGLMDRLTNDDQLAGVIAHEVAHITARHGIKRLQAGYGYMFLQVLAVQSGDAAFARGVQVAMTAAFTEYSQADEFESDKLGIKYMQKAGYDPAQMAETLQKLREQQNKEPSRPFSYWRTHPYLPQRISTVNREVSGQLKFEDYLNLTEPK